jgi:multiple sugar transport system ATP-binding protein
MRTELQRLQEELNVTAMYVTHDQTEAMTMGDRIAILNDGELQQVGTPMQCYHEPANRFVAGFIGEPAMNMLQASNEDGTLVAETFEYTLPEDIAAKLEGRTDVVLGARPEDIELVDDPDGEEPVTAFVELVEPHGNENAVQLSFVEGGATELTVTVDGMRSFRSGERVGVRFPEDTIHLFDAASGTALHNRKLTDVDRVEQIGVSQSA